MINILGIGHAYPEHSISLDDLKRWGTVEWSGGAVNISTVLPVDYIDQTGNEDPRANRKVVSENQSDLGYRAAVMALGRAGIEPSQLGLVVGGASNPSETCPAEAQRVCGRFGLKIPAYDFSCGTCDLPLQINTFSNWSDDRIPDYVLCIATSTPTQRVNYRSGMERYLFGDAASAVVLSTRNRGKLSVTSSQIRNHLDDADLMELDLYDHARIDFSATCEWMRVKLEEELTFATGAAASGDVILIFNQFLGQMQDELASQRGATSWSNVDQRGYSMSAGPVAVLSERWDEIQSGMNLITLFAGAGLVSGHVVLRGER